MILFNKTLWLIVPMAFYNKGIKIDNILHNDEFVGAYIGDLNRPEYDDKILIIYNDKEEIFDIPLEFKNDYWKIISSQYHEVSDHYWNVVNDFWEGHFKPPVESEDEFSLFEEIYNMEVL